MAVPTIYRESNKDYHARPERSSSAVKHALQGAPEYAAHVEEEADKRAKETDTYDAARAIGSAIHSIVLEGVYPVVSKWSAFSSNEAKTWRAEREAAGDIVIKSADEPVALAAANAVLDWHNAWITAGNFPLLPWPDAPALVEASIVDHERGERVRPDVLWLPLDANNEPVQPGEPAARIVIPPTIVSLKSTYTERQFGKACITIRSDARAGYDVGECYYQRVIARLWPGLRAESVECRWLAVDKRTRRVFTADLSGPPRTRAAGLLDQCLAHIAQAQAGTLPHDLSVRRYTVPSWADRTDHFTAEDN